MLAILDLLATREYSWGKAGCSGGNRKAKLAKKASPVLILSNRNMWSLELTHPEKARPFGRQMLYFWNNKEKDEAGVVGQARLESRAWEQHTRPCLGLQSGK